MKRAPNWGCIWGNPWWSHAKMWKRWTPKFWGLYWPKPLNHGDPILVVEKVSQEYFKAIFLDGLMLRNVQMQCQWPLGWMNDRLFAWWQDFVVTKCSRVFEREGQKLNMQLGEQQMECIWAMGWVENAGEGKWPTCGVTTLTAPMNEVGCNAWVNDGWIGRMTMPQWMHQTMTMMVHEWLDPVLAVGACGEWLGHEGCFGSPMGGTALGPGCHMHADAAGWCTWTKNAPVVPCAHGLDECRKLALVQTLAQQGGALVAWWPACVGDDACDAGLWLHAGMLPQQWRWHCWLEWNDEDRLMCWCVMECVCDGWMDGWVGNG